MMRLLQIISLTFIKRICVTPLVFIQLHRDILDILLRFRNNDMLKRIDPPPRLFNLTRHQLAGLFTLSQPQHIRQDVRQRLDRAVEVAGSKRKAVRINVVGIGYAGLWVKHRDINAHDIAFRSSGKPPASASSGNVEISSDIPARAMTKFLLARSNPCFYLFPKRLIDADKIQKLTHQLITLILQELMSPVCSCQLAL